MGQTGTRLLRDTQNSEPDLRVPAYILDCAGFPD